MGHASLAAERLTSIAASATSPLLDALADHAAAVASGDAGLLDDVIDRFEELGTMLYAAEAAAAAARLHRRAGRAAPALEAASRRDALAVRCEGAATPPLRTTADDVATVPLTAREREIVDLAAAGLSNREIADRLVISIRTAEGHLTRAYGKLGVRDRVDLYRVLGHSPRRRYLVAEPR